MINTKHVLKVGLSWMTITYVICFVGVALFPSLRDQFARNALHMEVTGLGQNIITWGTFISCLIWWNVLAFVGVGLFALLFNKIKK